MKIVVRCLVVECENYDQVINTITEVTADEAEMIVEQWKDASQEEDICPKCGELGEATEEEDDE